LIASWDIDLATPSTAWREQIAADEEARFAGYAEQFAALQRAKSARFGAGRALHRKQQLGLAATLDVLEGLPAHAAQGLFTQAQRFEVRVRLSNGGADKAADAKPDVRGFSFAVQGVQGESALGGPCKHQDFALIQHPAFAFARTDEFVGLAVNASNGLPALLKYLVGRYGLGGALKQMKKIAKTFGKPFKGFAAETFFSAAPIACGPYAVRVRLQPVDRAAAPAKGKAWAQDLAGRLRAGAITFDLQLQFFTDEATTPIEDASVDWPESAAPYVTVARLNLLKQDPDSAAGKALSESTEAAVFDPWSALAAHRPLGEVMRARKVVYYASQQGRGAA
jgi:hypothetical protein